MVLGGSMSQARTLLCRISARAIPRTSNALNPRVHLDSRSRHPESARNSSSAFLSSLVESSSKAIATLSGKQSQPAFLHRAGPPTPHPSYIRSDGHPFMRFSVQRSRIFSYHGPYPSPATRPRNPMCMMSRRLTTPPDSATHTTTLSGLKTMAVSQRTARHRRMLAAGWPASNEFAQSETNPFHTSRPTSINGTIRHSWSWIRPASSTSCCERPAAPTSIPSRKPSK